jgi:hypothetical protein
MDMKGQPQAPMKWSVLAAGLSAEMLSANHRPKKDEGGVYVFRAPLGEGTVPYIHLVDLALYAKWLFDHPEESAGVDL